MIKKKVKAIANDHVTKLPDVIENAVSISGISTGRYAASAEEVLMETQHIRTVTVVAEFASWKATIFNNIVGRKTHYMEPGRIAAQVGHSVSKLKLAYALIHPGRLERLIITPITSIVLGARDSEELEHIMYLCEVSGLLASKFYDENEDLYGTGIKVLTAISIGPIKQQHLVGITDYLPLWNDRRNQ